MTSIGNDLYLASGNVGILNYWNPSVTKFDSSTFYNWEQDNEPLYDLEERTDYLWERVGYPIEDGFSGIPGKFFSVSADAPFAGESSGTIFKSLSSVISVLPNPITYPIIIEVASWGNLGDLCLKNVKIDQGCNGAGLEIVNINHFRNYSYDPPMGYNSSQDASIENNGVGTALFQRLITTSSLLTGAKVSTNSIPNAADVRSSLNNRGYVIRRSYGLASVANNAGNLDVRIDASSYHATNSYLRVNLNSVLGGAGGVYDYQRDSSITSLDVSTYDSDDTTILSRENKATNDQHFVFLYGNYLKNIKVENCTGPIYIRNFCVDGGSDNRAGTVTQTEDYGVEITNSDVILENMFALRCKKAGFKFDNSNVYVRRGILAYRNYELSGSPGSYGRYSDRKTYGILAKNSTIDIQPTSFAGGTSSVSGVDILFQSSYNSVGLGLINSILKGGDYPKTGTFTSGHSTCVQAFYNTDAGIEAINSQYQHEGVTEVWNNKVGMDCDNSNIELPMFISHYNKEYGLKLTNSNILLNPKLRKITSNSAYATTNMGNFEQFHLYKNGQNINSYNSVISIPESTSLPTKFGIMRVVYPVGKDQVSTSKPSIVLNNTTAVLPHLYCTTHLDNFFYSNPIFGACVKVEDNSNVKIQGSKSGPTILLGFPSNDVNKVAAVHIDDNSMVEFNGPTLIGQAGVDILAENESTVKFGPHKTQNGNIDASSWDLTDGTNHTKVELHSIRACLVADKNSNIIMEDLGDFHRHWGNAVSSVDYNSDNSFGTSGFTSAGYMQFFANGQTAATLDVTATRVTLPSITYNVGGYFLVDPYATDPTTNASNHLQYSTGGMCVRALHGSNVKVLNVHFPAGWAQCNGNYYDSSATNCEMLRVWNICDDSTFDAAFCSVSSVYPSVAGYLGPSSVWISGVGGGANTYPSSTPDTSTLAVLDYYGASGSTQGKNYGPFRLYFSPNSRAKFLTTSASNGIDQGVPYQALAQGYNPSGACSAVGASAVSAIYADIVPAQFYYVSAMLDPSYFNRIRLDESAANTWANAKHNGIQKSGRLKLLSIYRSTESTEPGSQAFDATTDKYGKGLKSAEIFDLRRDN